MRNVRSLTLALAALALWAAPARAAVEVTFVAPAHFTDAAIRDTPMYGAIKTHLQRLGARYLGRGDTLRITVLDLDLAGQDMSSRGPSGLRVMNEATPPKIRLRYRLERNHRIVASGEDSLSDQFYLSRPGVGLSSDELRYEKSMLDDWFREKFSAGRTPAR